MITTRTVFFETSQESLFILFLRGHIHTRACNGAQNITSPESLQSQVNRPYWSQAHGGELHLPLPMTVPPPAVLAAAPPELVVVQNSPIMALARTSLRAPLLLPPISVVPGPRRRHFFFFSFFHTHARLVLLHVGGGLDFSHTFFRHLPSTGAHTRSIAQARRPAFCGSARAGSHGVRYGGPWCVIGGGGWWCYMAAGLLVRVGRWCCKRGG